jgi:hypothetical protein
MAFTETQVPNYKIYTLPQSVYDALVQSGGIDENAQYLTTNDGDPYGRVIVSNVNVPASLWADDSTTEMYTAAAIVPVTGITASLVPEVIFNMDDATGGNFAPVAESSDDGVKIYAREKPTSAIIIPTIILWR